MDCDLQDQPEEILKLYAKVQEGFDIVLARRVNRKDSFFKKHTSRFYYSLLSYLTDTNIDYTVGTFRILSKPVVEHFIKMREYFRFFGAMINWMGFNVFYLNIEHKSRNDGKSAYTLKKSIKLALNGVLSFSDKPLKLTIKFGILIVFFSSLYIFYKLANILLYGTSAIGWSSLIASIFFSTGIIVTILGMIGLYIGRIFEQVKQRPLYIIKQTTKSLIYE
jgi:dolichol-phosphate mannosyltransferase